jgi:hypothetical protein
MTEWENIEENAKKAFENNEFYEFLTGRNGYSYYTSWLNVNIPTDWTSIIPNGIYKLYEETKDAKIIEAYEDAIIKAINGDAEDLWSAFNVLFFQLDHENMGKSPFKISKRVTAGLKEKVIASKENLEKNYPNGKNNWNMYEDILRLNNIYSKDWKKNIFD